MRNRPPWPQLPSAGKGPLKSLRCNQLPVSSRERPLAAPSQFLCLSPPLPTPPNTHTFSELKHWGKQGEGPSTEGLQGPGQAGGWAALGASAAVPCRQITGAALTGIQRNDALLSPASCLPRIPSLSRWASMIGIHQLQGTDTETRRNC